MSSFIGLFLAYTTLGIWQSSFISSSPFSPYGTFYTMKVSLGCRNILGINTWGRKWAGAEKIFGLWCRPDITLANSRLIDAELSCVGPKWSNFYIPSLLSHSIGIIYSKRALLSAGRLWKSEQLETVCWSQIRRKFSLEEWSGSCIFEFITHTGLWWTWERWESKPVSSCSLLGLNW